jgi:WD40 repeat protein
MKKTILFLSANPSSTSRLRLDEEMREIQDGLRRGEHRDSFDLQLRPAVRPRDIRRALLDTNPNIIHFSGHGSGEEGLVFEDETGNPQLVNADALSSLFELFADQIECLVLNACYSEVQAEATVEHIPFVIGMNAAIGDKAAIEFSMSFYDAIVAGKSIEFAYKLGRSAIQMEGVQGHLIPVLKTKRIGGEIVGVAESDYETISESPEALSKIQRNHSAIQQRQIAKTIPKDIPATDDEIYGREQEIEALKSWLKPGLQSLVCAYGLSGIGKTTLVVKVVREVAGQFDNQVMWISLQDQQSYERVLALMLQRFEEMGGDRASLTGATALEQCLQMMQVSACLVVLEDFHRVLPRWERLSQQGKDKEAGQENWRAYRGFLERLNSMIHRSSVVVVSREQPRFFSEESGSARVHSIELEGLDKEAIERFVIERKVTKQVDAEVLERLWKQSMGHPLTLKLSGARIRNLFDGDIQAFLNTGSLAYGGLKDVLTEEFKVLTLPEKEVLYWLLINRDPVETRTPIKFGMLRADVLMLSLVDAEEKLGDCLDSLMRKSLIDSDKGAYRLHELVGDYVKECLVEDVVAELVGDDRTELYFLNHCALVKAKSNDSIRQRQVREVITPIVQRLQANGLERPEEQKVFFTRLVERARNLGVPDNSYLVSNIVQLCRSLKIDLTNFNFSGLLIRQANFRGVNLHNVNFARARVVDCVFNDIFGGVLCVRCSPDGKLLASSDTDGNISIWNYYSRELRIRFKAHTSWIFQMRFSPDGRFLISASEDQYCCVWQIETGKRIQCILAPKRLLALDLSPDGKQVAAAGEGGEIFLWNLENSQLVHTFRWKDLGLIWSCAFSPDGKSLVSAGADSAIWQWNLQDGTGTSLIQETSIQCRALVYSPDGKYLARVSERNIIRVWDTEAKCDVAELKGHSQEIWTLIFGRDSNELISAGTDKWICVWNIEQQKQIRTFHGHDATIYSIAYQSKNFEIVSGSADQSICFWDYFADDVDKQKLNQLQGFFAGVRSIAFLPGTDRYCLISGGSDQLVYRWDFPEDIINGNSHHDQVLVKPIIFPKSHSGFIWTVSYGAQQNLIASAGDDNNIYLWDAQYGSVRQVLFGHTWTVHSISFSSDSRYLASGSMDGTIRVWDLMADTSREIKDAHADGVRSVRFTPDGQYLVSCGHDELVKIWDVKNCNCITAYSGHKGFVYSVDISSDGDLIASCGDDKTIRLWNFSSENASEIAILDGSHTGWIRSVCFSPKDDFIASGSEDGLVCLWSMESKKIKWSNEHVNKDGIKCVTFSQDGKLLASASNDGVIELWEMDKILIDSATDPVVTLRTVQPYRGLKIADAVIANEQRQLLRRLGAIDIDSP